MLHNFDFTKGQHFFNHTKLKEMKKINLKLQREGISKFTYGNTTSQFYFPLRYTSTMTHKWTTAWSNALLKPNGHTALCPFISNYTIIYTSLCVHIYVCTCLSGSMSCSPFVWGLRRWSGRAIWKKLDRLASLHKISNTESSKAGRSELWRETTLLLLQAWSKEENSWSINQGQLAE